MPHGKKKICHCKPTCGKLRSLHTRRKHYKREAALGRQREPSESISPDDSDSHSLRIPSAHSSSSADSDTDPSSESNFSAEMDVDQDQSSVDNPVQDKESDQMDIDSCSDEPFGIGLGRDTEWLDFDEELDLDKVQSLEEKCRELDEMLEADDEQNLWDIRNRILTPEDRDNIRAFKLTLVSKMPRAAFAQMRFSFRHKLEISSHWAMLHRIAILAHVEPMWFDCCPSSCHAYLGKYADLTECFFCGEQRFTSSNKPRRLFCYLPVIPRLQAFFANPRKIDTMLYRHRYEHRPHEVSDVFDGRHYRTLLKTRVTVDGKTLPHSYFSGKYDVALGICLDGYLLFNRKRGGPSATPILVQNYNIPPDNGRTHLNRQLCAGVIPGPHSPKDTLSFLIPFDDECVRLAIGVPTYNCITGSIFTFHAYNIFGMGDIVAIEKLLNIKGHNGFCPCRSCKIKGVRNVTAGQTIYYVPLTEPDKPGKPRRKWNPLNLPLRTHQDWITISDNLEHQPTAAARKNLSFDTGIKGLPALSRVGSLDSARSYPWDVMHLFFENNIRNLVNLWSGKFKGLDSGVEDYEIAADVWEEIWAETAQAVKHIPADFCRSLASGPSYFTAESWCFWFTYLAPILLKDRFNHSKYHDHLCDFAGIIKTCISFTLTHAQIETLRATINNWVETYELFYYQYSESRLSTCTLTIHGLLHVPDDILFCGPSWTTSTFWMERYCGFLKGALRSKKSPWANLNNIVLQRSYLEQLDALYDVSEELEAPGGRVNGLSSTERKYDGYPQAILGVPLQRRHSPPDSIRHKIAGYFANLVGKKPGDIRSKLPEVMPRWGNLRIDTGDSISCAWVLEKRTEVRNTSFIRFEMEIKKSSKWVPKLFYGELQEILVCDIPTTDKKLWGKMHGRTCLLAVITPYRTGGRDAALEPVSWQSQALDTVVTDIQGIMAVVGRIQARDKWHLIDRTGGMIRPEFIPSEELEEGLDEDEG